MTKRTIIIPMATLLVLALAVFAYAGPRGGGQGFNQLTAEQQEAAQKVFDKYHEGMVELRQKLWTKQAELDALTESGTATRDDIKGLVADIGELRADMYEQRQDFSAELEKETGITGFGRGYHRGMGGGKGGGYASNGCPGSGQGYGPGNCPGNGGGFGGGCGRY